MARSKPDKRLKKRKKKTGENGVSELPSLEKARALLDEATILQQTGQPEQALPLAKKSLQCFSSLSVEAELRVPAIERLAEVYLELGDGEKARATFLEAAKIDPLGEVWDGLNGGGDKFLWLAQLSEEGGAESVQWFEKGIAALKRELGLIGDDAEAIYDDEEYTVLIEDKKHKLANALCGVAEIYMTDLSWEDEAEARCETLVTEACLIAPQSPEPLQTLASVRISQTKMDDARAALDRSLQLWTNLEPEDPKVPDFPTRISLARLLMEVEFEDKALNVLERLVAEDDTSVEAWYLGGWCLYLLSKKLSKKPPQSDWDEPEESKYTLKSSHEWLENSLRLYSLLDYEDDRLRDHAEELITELNGELGAAKDPEDDADRDDDVWEDEDDSDTEHEEAQLMD